MTTYQYDLAVFIGRFQPYHNGHHAVIQQALQISNKVAVIIGSANSPRTIRNPFTVEERKLMIIDSFSSEDQSRIVFGSIEDTIYNDELWVKNIQNTVKDIYDKSYGGFAPMARITLIGHNKDNSSFYLKLFPQWKSMEVDNYLGMSATEIRTEYFKTVYKLPRKETTESVYQFMWKFMHTQLYRDLHNEAVFIERYKDSWKVAPFPPIFVTVDAVVIQSGHILLIQRKAKPGEGLWALPGGFLNKNEYIDDGVIRELKEETKIKVPEAVLYGSIVKKVVFDDPHRSSRGRTITHAYLIHLKPNTDLPKVKGSDDAIHAKWFPLNEVSREIMYDDHMDIILNMTAEI